jgi:hypothetical protein
MPQGLCQLQTVFLTVSVRMCRKPVGNCVTMPPGLCQLRAVFLTLSVRMCREPVGSCVLMLQPRLWRYSCDSEVATPVRLDVDAVDPSAVMVLDSWFNVVVHTGTHVASWRRQVRRDSTNAI